ncbi:SLC13 family permease (plasmid) [Cetobacterium somerae]|uniref:SLC13 family permease n=1 Tax=Cetobacterium somerae TaxID=188913 RepID=UPI003D769FAC
MESLGLISLIFLIAVVGLGFWRKINIGILAIGSAIILGKIGGIGDKAILQGFDATMFITLVGVTFLFGIAQINGTLELLAKKAVALVGNKTYLVPIIIFIVTGVLSAIGPGNIPIGALMTVVAVTIAVYMKQNPILLALVAKLASNGFAMSPLTPAGIIGLRLGERAGYSNFIMPVMYNVILWSLVLLVGFLILFRDKEKKVGDIKNIKIENLETFDKNQKITMTGIAIMMILVIGMGINVGLASFFVASILLAMKVCNEKKALSSVPWGTLLLICGVGVLMNIVEQLGGIEIISKGLLSIMTPRTAAPIISLTSSVLSFFSSTTGVVMPTMIPALPNIVHNFPGTVSFIELQSVVITGSFSAAFSPASTGGGLILAAYMASTDSTQEEQNKLFGKLFTIAIGCVILNIALSAIGLYKLF